MKHDESRFHFFVKSSVRQKVPERSLGRSIAAQSTCAIKQEQTQSQSLMTSNWEEIFAYFGE
ncbi:MAG: hypothetical protein ACR2LR_08185 [Hassallia sp.]